MIITEAAINHSMFFFSFVGRLEYKWSISLADVIETLVAVEINWVRLTVSSTVRVHLCFTEISNRLTLKSPRIMTSSQYL